MQNLHIFTTGQTPSVAGLANTLKGDKSSTFNGCIYNRRMTHSDLLQALGPPSQRQGLVAYVCGPAAMTDELVGVLRRAEGMKGNRVLCENWW